VVFQGFRVSGFQGNGLQNRIGVGQDQVEEDAGRGGYGGGFERHRHLWYPPQANYVLQYDDVNLMWTPKALPPSDPTMGR
jgi:hypothetical protein